MQRPAAALLVATLAGLPACSSTYQPAPGPRISMVQNGGRPMLVKNGQQYDLGLFGGGLVEAVESNPAAREHAESFRDHTIAGFAMALGGVAVTAGGSGLLAASVGTESRTSEVTGASLMLAGLGLAIAGLMVTTGAPPHMYDAINIYNDGVSPPPGWPPPAGWPAPPPGALAPLAQPPVNAPILPAPPAQPSGAP